MAWWLPRGRSNANFVLIETSGNRVESVSTRVASLSSFFEGNVTQRAEPYLTSECTRGASSQKGETDFVARAARRKWNSAKRIKLDHQPRWGGRKCS